MNRTVTISLNDILAIVSLLREEEGMTGQLAREGLANMLDEPPTLEEVLAYARGISFSPDDEGEVQYHALPIVEFGEDPSLWEQPASYDLSRDNKKSEGT